MEKFFKGVGQVVVVIIVMLAMSVPSTWFVMLALGILHHRWEQIPAFGYWETYVVLVAFNFVLGAVKKGARRGEHE